MKTKFVQLITPTIEMAKTFNKWANDPMLIPLLRPNRNQAELEAQTSVTVASLTERLEHNCIYLIYVDDQLVGEMNFLLDFDYLYKKESGTAWIGIAICEFSARHKGVGAKALDYLEKQIKLQGHRRIELGVFAFNTVALKLYKNRGYKEIGRIKEFTLWQDKMWADIRMEKHLKLQS